MKMFTIALTSLTMAERASLSVEMLLRGMGTVFMVLILLWLILKIFGSVFGGATKDKPMEKPAAPAPAPRTATTHTTGGSNVSAAVAIQDDSQLVAVITAAIAEYMRAEGKSNLPFRVVSFTRKNNASGWMGNSADNQ